MEEQHRSVSQLTTYAGCSEAYRLKYIEKLSGYPAAWLAQGTAFHEVIDEYENGSGLTASQLVAKYQWIYDRIIREFDEAEPDRSKWLKAPKSTSENDISNRRELGSSLIANYLTFSKERRPLFWVDDYTPGIELPIYTLIGDVRVKGQIDRIEREEDGTLHIIDLKTGNRESAKLQLGIYKVCLEKEFGIKVSKASFFYAKDGKLASLTDYDLARYNEQYIIDLLATLERGIQNEVFIPNVTQSCMLCPVKRKCREFK